MQNQTPPISNQDAFNRVYQHFIVEKNPQCLGTFTNSEGKTEEGCVYRFPTKDNKPNGCAVGCMLPDDLAAIADSNRAISSAKTILVEYKSIGEWFKNVSAECLQDLQTWHDCYLGRFDELDKLVILARRHGLEMPTTATAVK